MKAIGAELIKLKRSLSWAVVVLLPILLVVSGSIMTLIDGRPLEDGWHTLWMRSIVFYGLFPLAVGIAILASLVWRAEHRGGNWNALMSGPTSSLRIVLAKAAVIGMLAAIMQALAVATTIVLGKLVFHLPGFLPGEYLIAAVAIIVACFPVAVLQSWLSMLMRSFAAPVAVAFVGAGFSAFLLVLKLTPAIFISPYATVSRATQLGTSTFADTGEVTGPVIALIIGAALALSAVLTAANTAVLERGDTRT
ncbi:MULTISPECIES: ABC transporter permease [Micrococcaceae]|uniref:ABC transporter permease n=1 Tax=Micrococcaceae TaxID=1268 RepID=UPI0022DE5D0A|nr:MULTISPECIES: ABC transporter permease [Micrococcaceae]WBL18946.1 ABC transporter permease [Citricoccus sp. NR2]